MQKLDPTTWPKVEGEVIQISGVYFTTGVNGPGAAHLPKGYALLRNHFTYYGPIEFATNDAPETVTLYEVSIPDVSEKKWAFKDEDGRVLSIDGYTRHKGDYTILRSQVYVNKAATAG